MVKVSEMDWMTHGRSRAAFGPIGRLRRPKVVHFEITDACNSRCAPCRFGRSGGKGLVPLEDAQMAIDVLAASGCGLISITGGEPFLHPHLVEICQHARRREVLVSYIATNGTLVTEGIARELARAGVNVVGLSLDPQHAHPGRRTRDVPPETVAEAREVLEATGVRTYAAMLLNRDLPHVTDCVAFAGDLGFTRTVLYFPQCSEAAPHMASADMEALRLDAANAARLVREVREAKRRSTILNPAPVLQDVLRLYRGERQLHPCLGGSRIFYLDWRLELRTCFTLPWTYGDLVELGGLPDGPGRCTHCTQQAFRDLSYILDNYESIGSLHHSLAGLEGRAAGSVALRRGLVQELHALVDLYMGGV